MATATAKFQDPLPLPRPNRRSFREAFMRSLAEFGKVLTREEQVIAARQRWIPYCCFTPLKVIWAHMARFWLDGEMKRREVNRQFRLIGADDQRQTFARPSGKRLILAR